MLVAAMCTLVLTTLSAIVLRKVGTIGGDEATVPAEPTKSQV